MNEGGRERGREGERERKREREREKERERVYWVKGLFDGEIERGEERGERESD